MTHLTETELLNFNRIGFIPGPDETQEAFCARVEYCLSIQEELEGELDFPREERSEKEALRSVFPETRNWMDIAPDWIPLYFSNYKLSPWHGGCAWIFQKEEESPTGAFLQLRKSLRTKGSCFGYSLNEILVHELSHVGRMMFEEPKYEEVIAYRTSASRLHRWLGPIVQSSLESMLFVIVLLLILMTDLAVLYAGDSYGYSMALWLKLIPLGMIFLALLRLALKQRRLGRCLAKLSELRPAHANAILYRLTDEEIQAFARMRPEEIREYAENEAKQSLRWKVIHRAYFSRP